MITSFFQEEPDANTKYIVYPCKCGCIHIIPGNKIEAACKSQKVSLIICGNCGNLTDYCGKIEDGISDCLRILGEVKCISLRDMLSASYIAEIIYDKGVPIRLSSGKYANHYKSDKGFLADNDDCNEVDMSFLLSMVTPIQAQAISEEGFAGMYWDDTPFVAGSSSAYKQYDVNFKVDTGNIMNNRYYRVTAKSLSEAKEIARKEYMLHEYSAREAIFEDTMCAMKIDEKKSGDLRDKLIQCDRNGQPILVKEML